MKRGNLGTSTFKMYIDGKPCAGTSMGGASLWQQLVEQGDTDALTVSDNYHTVSIMAATAYSNTQVEFGFDDIAIFYVSGPDEGKCLGWGSSPLPSSTLILSSSPRPSSAALAASSVPSSSSTTSTPPAVSTPSPSPTSASTLSTTVVPTSFATLVSSSSPSPSPSTCSSKTNRLTNGQFTNGLSGWSDIKEDSTPNVALQGVIEGAGHKDTTHYSLTTKNGGGFGAAVVLEQYDVLIPSGSTVRCSYWTKVTRSSESSDVSFLMYIDGQVCAGNLVMGASDWKEIHADPFVLSGRDTHTIQVYASLETQAMDEVVVGIDDVGVYIVKGPDGKTCAE
ncbi:hypothetical protein CC86DRAFT_408811 [Ophiobolus disseminans]|uniref:CBM-cenC domain-containing protein n=1 Tax=Ophiobolus disseminans TaxID=1469910 RepID=A0A6A6ZT54_9PLEO|nr:hypothetical protein CC86DRAFT_408811 [Ophiobolus disseminans]